MKILILNSSPKAEKGNTHIITQAFSEGAQSAGATVKTIFLVKYKINPCMACLNCWSKTPGHCILKDDAEELINQLSNADLIVFATPLYVDNVSGIMKNFMDRMIMNGCPNVEIDENHEAKHIINNEHHVKIAVISSCGFPEQSQFQVLRLLFKRVARNMKAELVAEIYRGEGPLLSDGNERLKPIIDDYIKLVKAAGHEVVTQGRLSKTLMEKLEKPLMPYDVYLEKLNAFFDNH